MNIEEILTEDQVIILENTEKQLVIKEMVSCLERLNKIKDASKYYTQVIHRESLDNTGLGSEFAIPHARTESVADYLTVFAKSNEGIEYDAIDKKPVKYLFLSIFPTAKSLRHVYTISIFSRLFSDEKMVGQLENATTPKKIYKLLEKDFSKLSSKSPQEIITKEHVNEGKAPSANLELLLRLDRLYKSNENQDSNEDNNKKIENLRRLIDGRFLTYYERMKKKGKNPFSVLNKNSCTECHMDIAPMHMADILESDNIPLCNHCGRILIIV